MASRWSAIEGLMREIGATRADALGLYARDVGAAIVAEIDRAITGAAGALDAAITNPEDEKALVAVCEAIVVARERIDGVRRARERAGAAVAMSVEVRRRAARTLLESVRLRSGRNR